MNQRDAPNDDRACHCGLDPQSMPRQRRRQAGSRGDGLNEIHPNAAGWDKLAAVGRRAIQNVL